MSSVGQNGVQSAIWGTSPQGNGVVCSEQYGAQGNRVVLQWAVWDINMYMY